MAHHCGYVPTVRDQKPRESEFSPYLKSENLTQSRLDFSKRGEFLSTDVAKWGELMQCKLTMPAQAVGTDISYLSAKANDVTSFVEFFSQETLARLQAEGPTKDIRFSIQFSNHSPIAVHAVESRLHWHIKFSTHDQYIKIKLERHQKNLARSIGKALNKRVIVDVD